MNVQGGIFFKERSLNIQSCLPRRRRSNAQQAKAIRVGTGASKGGDNSNELHHDILMRLLLLKPWRE
jgi:hypothetical protein